MVSGILKLFIKAENISRAVFVGNGHDYTVCEANCLWLPHLSGFLTCLTRRVNDQEWGVVFT